MNQYTKYTAIQLGTTVVDGQINPKLSFGTIDSYSSPDIEFDTEQEATEYAHKVNKWGRWLILPITLFNNFD